MQSDSFEASAGQPLALDPEAVSITTRLARWLKITGSIQLAFAGLALAVIGMSTACGMLSGDLLAMLGLAVPIAIAATFLLQALRIQAAGEQFDNLANELHVDYLELAFGRLRTVFAVELVIASLWLLRLLLNLVGGA